MANNSSTTTDDNLFSSLISDIKTYNGTDPLIPWLRGIRKMTNSLPPQLLEQKLPRFLQKCAQTFQTDARYRNDLRYLRVWMKLVDFVDDPGAVLKKMKVNQIGHKSSLFYQAYALYYEKMKKFADAEKMYHLGVQNLAEPADELQKSFDQFLQRMERHKNKRIQRQVEGKKVISQSMGNEKGKMVKSGSEIDEHIGEDARHHGLVEPTINTKEAMDAINSMFREPLGPEPFQKHNSHKTKTNNDGIMVFNDNESVDPSLETRPVDEPFQIYCDNDNDNDNDNDDDNEVGKGAFVFPNPKDILLECSRDPEPKRAPQPEFREDTVVFRFVGSTVSEEPKVENVCHHGLVEPTVNLKEAMDDINNMFGKPMEFVRKRRPRKQFEEKQDCSSFLILADDETGCNQENVCKPSSSSLRKENDLFEQTVCTKEAIDDINKMFAMPLDF